MLRKNNFFTLELFFTTHVSKKYMEILPYWLFFISTISLFNTLQSFYSTRLTKLVYSNDPAQGNSWMLKTSHPFDDTDFWDLDNSIGIYSIICIFLSSWSSVISFILFSVYFITLATFVVALIHFLSEFLIFKSMKAGPGMFSPLMVAIISLTWMINSVDYYTIK